MIRSNFNDGWAVRPKANRHAEMSGLGQEWTPVTLPHDAIIGTQRSPFSTAQTGYFPGGTWEYRKLFHVPSEHSGSTLVMAFEGVYRDAVVTVNGSAAGHRPYGYSKFFVPIHHLVRGGSDNEVVVTARSSEDSRWYSGAGIYRNVWLLRAGRTYFPPDRLEVRTPEIDDGGAVIDVLAVVRNESAESSRPVLRVELLDGSGAVISRDDAPVTVFPDDTVAVRRRLFVGAPRRWGPDHPYLYTCRVTLLEGNDVLDGDASTFGIRSLSLDPKRGLRINGEHVDLRGACVHHDNGPLGAATIDRAEQRRVDS